MDIHSIAVLWVLVYKEPEAYLKPCETLTRNIQNSATGRCSAIFWTLWNTCIHRTLTYSGSWNVQNPSIIPSLCIFRTLSYYGRFTNIQNSDIYSELSQSRLSFCKKIVKTYNYFSKALCLRSLTRFWIKVLKCLNKYSLTCKVTLC